MNDNPPKLLAADILKFRRLYYKHFKVYPSEEQSIQQAQALLRIVQLLTKRPKR